MPIWNACCTVQPSSRVVGFCRFEEYRGFVHVVAQLLASIFTWKPQCHGGWRRDEDEATGSVQVRWPDTLFHVRVCRRKGELEEDRKGFSAGHVVPPLFLIGGGGRGGGGGVGRGEGGGGGGGG